MHDDREFGEDGLRVCATQLPPWRAEHGLWFQVVLDALDLALGREPGAPSDIDEAIAWILTPEERVAGFDWACNFLNLEPGLIRGLVERSNRSHSLGPGHRSSTPRQRAPRQHRSPAGFLTRARRPVRAAPSRDPSTLRC